MEHTAEDARPAGTTRLYQGGAPAAVRLPRRPRVDREYAAGSKRWLPALRDSIAFKVCYAFGLRCRELTMLDVYDFGPNPHVSDYGQFGAVQVRWAKGTAGSGPRRRTVLTAPGGGKAAQGTRSAPSAPLLRHPPDRVRIRRRVRPDPGRPFPRIHHRPVHIGLARLQTAGHRADDRPPDRHPGPGGASEAPDA